MFKGVFFSVDPGGTNAIIPIAKKIIEEGDVQTFNFAASFAIPLWKQSGLEFTPLPNSITKEEIHQLLKKINPDFLFTGTSEDTSMEGNFWLSAKQLGVFSYSIIDHWTRYRERYLVEGALFPTDIIFTIDENSEKEMISHGFESTRIVVSGQPHFEEFVEFKSNLSRHQFCNENALLQRKIITFVSDNITGSFPEVTPGIPPLGFDERSILDKLINELESIPNVIDEFQLIIKLHPKEPEDNFSGLLTQARIPFRVIKGGSNMDLIFHSDFVIGMFSMLLFEAYLMMRPVISLQLNALKPIEFGLNKIPIVVEQKQMKESIRKFLFEGTKPRTMNLKPATKKTIEIIRCNLYDRGPGY